jgi:hypothetical protein
MSNRGGGVAGAPRRVVHCAARYRSCASVEDDDDEDVRRAPASRGLYKARWGRADVAAKVETRLCKVRGAESYGGRTHRRIQKVC